MNKEINSYRIKSKLLHTGDLIWLLEQLQENFSGGRAFKRWVVINQYNKKEDGIDAMKKIRASKQHIPEFIYEDEI